MLQHTNAIILRQVKYGESSIIVTAYTEKFGLQSYIVKGVRQVAKKTGSNKAIYFQPGAILEMEVYHNELKNLQFVKDYQWHIVYQQVFFNVARNSIALYIVELLLHSIRQTETNEDLFAFILEGLMAADSMRNSEVANLPLVFTLQLCNQLGFQLQGQYNEKNQYLDLQQGFFVSQTPLHVYFVSGDTAKNIGLLLTLNDFNSIGKIALSRIQRENILQALQQFLTLHIAGYGELKSLPVLKTILG